MNPRRRLTSRPSYSTARRAREAGVEDTRADDIPKVSEDRRGLLGWLGGNVTAALTICGLVIYGVQRISYDLYYRSLETTPEEVGLGYAQILGQTVVGFLVLLVLAFALAFFYWLTLGLYVHFARTAAAETAKSARLIRAQTTGGRRNLVGLGVGVLLAVLIVATIVVTVVVAVERFAPDWLEATLTAVSAGAGVIFAVAKGWARVRVTSRAVVVCALVATLLVTLFTLLLTLENVAVIENSPDEGRSAGTVASALQDASLAPPLNARRASIDWAGPSSNRGQVFWSDCVFYLGTANGVSIFYDAEEKQSLRLPATSITIRLDDSDC